jgi:hypothetical protein
VSGWVAANPWVVFFAWVIPFAAISTLGVITWAAVSLTRRLRTWHHHGDPAEAVTAPQPRLRVVWQSRACGCCWGSNGRSYTCPACAMDLPEVRDLFTWKQDQQP